MLLSLESLLVGAFVVPLAEMARRSPQMGFTSLAYLMDIDWLIATFHRTRKDGAPGVDGQTAEEQGQALKVNFWKSAICRDFGEMRSGAISVSKDPVTR